MRKVLITGANGFIGKNLIEALQRETGIALMTYDINDSRLTLDGYLREADIIFHLAGVNRPERSEEFYNVNVGLTKEICEFLIRIERAPLIVFSSSTQALLNNPYGESKRQAEEVLKAYAERSGARAYLFRLPGVFGKWCRPNYNSVVATFCYNIAHNLNINISDPNREIELVYIDDVVREFVKVMADDKLRDGNVIWGEVNPTFKVALGQLADKIREFRATRENLTVPDFSDRFTKYLYATYLSYLNGNEFAYEPKPKADERGVLVELLKSKYFGQIFISRTKPGVTRGNHYHNTKTEKFCVIEGEAVLRFRNILSKEVFTYHLSGKDLRVVDIPPGYTHSIENIGQSEMIVLFWACEPFDPAASDTYPAEVLIG